MNTRYLRRIVGIGIALALCATSAVALGQVETPAAPDQGVFPAAQTVPAALTGVSSIAADGSYTCALTTGGGVKCWGSNSQGQLGDDSTTDRHTPVTVRRISSSQSSSA